MQHQHPISDVTDDHLRAAIRGFCRMTGEDVPSNLHLLSRHELIQLYNKILIAYGCAPLSECQT